MKKTVVIGGGFTGLNFAENLSNVADFEIVLVDKINTPYHWAIAYFTRNQALRMIIRPQKN